MKPRVVAIVLAIGSIAIALPQAAAQGQSASVQILPVRGNIYMLLGAGGNITLKNVQYLNNTAGNLGGGALSFNIVSIVDSQFMSNTANGNWGGGLFAAQAANITNTLFISNASTYAGGGLGVQFGSVTVIGGRFERNYAAVGGWGGAIYDGGPSLTVSGTQFLSNTAIATGGGTWSNATILTNTTYINNSAGSWGGGAEGAGPTQVYSSLFQNNRTQANGGGISSGSSVFVRMLSTLRAPLSTSVHRCATSFTSTSS